MTLWLNYKTSNYLCNHFSIFLTALDFVKFESMVLIWQDPRNQASMTPYRNPIHQGPISLLVSLPQLNVVINALNKLTLNKLPWW